MNQVKLINVQPVARRVLLLLPLLLAIAGTWVAGHWFFANVFAEVVPAAGDAGRESLLWALQAGPDDPLTHRAWAGLARRGFTPAEQQTAVQQLTEAARLSPHDYRIWIDLGQTRQQIDDAEGAEKALRQAVALAPHYAAPRWFLGNFLLRKGRNDEAFAELRQAADADPEYRPQFYNAVWQVSGKDVAWLQRAAGDKPEARAELARYLLSQQRPDDALQVWTALDAATQKQFAALGETMLRGFIDAKKYQAALSVARGLAASAETAPALGQITNGGFEQPDDKSAFAWQAQTVAQAQIGTDTARQHSGKNSLRVNFKATGALDFRNIAQLVAVTPGTRYRLDFYVRTDTLKTAGPPLVQVLDAATLQVLAGSAAAPAGTSKDWLPASVTFAARSEGVIVRLARESCGTDTSCPIFGTVWYDDFNLARL